MSRVMLFIGGALMGSGLTVLYNEGRLAGQLAGKPPVTAVAQPAATPAGPAGRGRLQPEAGCANRTALIVTSELRFGQGWEDDGFRITQKRGEKIGLSVWYANDVSGLGATAGKEAFPGSDHLFTDACRLLIYRAVGTAQERLVAAAL